MNNLNTKGTILFVDDEQVVLDVGTPKEDDQVYEKEKAQKNLP